MITYPRVFILLALVVTAVTGITGDNEERTARGTSLEHALKISSIPNNSPIQTQKSIVPLQTQKIQEKTPEITAEIMSVATVDNHRLRSEFRAQYRHPIASITKLMTAIVAEKLLDNAKRITIEENDVAAEGPAGNFTAGEIFSVEDLIKAMLVVSSNDAATALAREIGTKTFVDIMQQTAREFGMDNTVFFDPTGLSSLNQSTAEDLEKLINNLRTHHEHLLRTTRATTATILDERNRQFRILNNINEFAGINGFLGGKTGYTDEARGNLISLFMIKNEQVLITVLGSNNRFADTRKLYDWSKKMLE